MIVAVGTVAGMSQTNAALSVVLLSTVWGSLCSATTIPLRASPHPMLRSDRGPIGAAPGMLGQAQPPLYLRGGASEMSPTTSWWSRTDSDQMNGTVPSRTGRFVREHNKQHSMGVGIHANDVKDNYDIKGVLGEGGFATVRQARHKKTGKKVAIKTIDLFKIQADKLDMLQNEVEVMKMLDHPNIVRLYETYAEDDKLHLVMEHCSGGDLFDFLMKTNIEEGGHKTWSDGEGVQYALTEKRVSALVHKMLSAVNYLHARGIAHRDIKPENFLLETKATNEGPGEIKMIDFGFSKVFHGTEDMHNMLGSPYYVAPEVLGASKDKGYGKACDIWSIGVVVYTMLCGCPPFYGDDNAAIYKSIESGVYEWPEDVEVSQEAKDFIGKLLTLDPQERITAHDALQHEWITNAEDLDDTPLTNGLLSSLREVHDISQLKKEALLAIGYSMDRDSIRQMRSTFRALDKDGTGTIKLDELQMAMKKHGMSEDQVEKMFMSISAGSAHGEIDYTSFVAACLEKRSYLEHSNLYEAFHRFQDGSGCITKESLMEILGTGRFTAQEIDEMVKEADMDGDGSISFAEFTIMMGNRLPVARMAWRVLPLLEGLTADEVSQIFEISNFRFFKAGDELLAEGQDAHSFFLIEEGEVEISRQRETEISPMSRSGSVEDMAQFISELAVTRSAGETATGVVENQDIAQAAAKNGTRDVIVLLAAKTVVGEMEFVANEKRLATVTATTPVKATEVPYRELKVLLDRDVALGYKVMTNIARIAARGVAQMNKMFSNFGSVLDLYEQSRKNMQSGSDDAPADE
mmetsp:Transcript_57761/g.135863  ORF Transcript_57761/g.135863 Transcript_57761/m.135863 type:complete len:803 (-) Transcript_57761:221-2629(-)